MVQRLEFRKCARRYDDHTRNACRLDNMQSRSTHATAGTMTTKHAVSFYMMTTPGRKQLQRWPFYILSQYASR